MRTFAGAGAAFPLATLDLNESSTNGLKSCSSIYNRAGSAWCQADDSLFDPFSSLPKLAARLTLRFTTLIRLLCFRFPPWKASKQDCEEGRLVSVCVWRWCSLKETIFITSQKS